jgi:hypothetical protein
MNFSLILNTRRRTKILDSFFRSFVEKTKDLNQIELLVRVDNDDHETKGYLGCDNIHRDFPNFQAYFGDRPKSLNGSLSELALKAKGRFVFLLNDDVEMLTPNWDVRALKAFEDFKAERSIKDDILYGYTHDTSADKTGGAGYASFPIISSQAIQSLGFIMYPAFVGLGGDSSIYRVYKEIDRVVDTKVGLDHVLHNTVHKVVNPDQTAAEMRANTAANPVDPFTYDISNDVAILRLIINTPYHDK